MGVGSRNEWETMRVGYVVLYVQDADACLRFWTEQVGMIEKGSKQAGAFSIRQVGFADQDFSFELVPLALDRKSTRLNSSHT